MRESPDMMTRGSENFMLTGLGKLQVFKGLTIIPGKLGSIVMMNVAEDFAGLGSGTPYGPTSVIDGTAFGNVFNVFSALFFIGKGLLRVSGVDALSYKPSPPAPLPPPVPVVADTTLQLLVKYNGSYTDPLSGPWQAGLAQPSAPSIQAVNPPTGFSGKVNGVVSVVTWRIRSTTGAVSIQSEVSNIVSAFNQSIAVTLPLPDANGQDYWGIGVTLNQEGSTGSHFELTEIPESDVSHSVVKVNMAITAGSPTIQSVGATFTSDMIGWPVILSGGTPDIGTPFNSYVIAVPAADQLTLAANAPTTSTGVHMTASTGAAGTPRTVVVEWRDGDLVGKPLAPTRDFPPPEGLYAGSLQDLTFVDGCYGDNSLTPTSNRPSAIAPSEFGKPESFSPDTVIFTNDTPVGLIRGDEVYWRLCKNSVYVLRYIQGLSVEPVWQNMGCDYQHNAVLGEGGRLYMWPTKRGPIRMDYYGLVDASFAVKIADDLIDCTDAVQRVLGWYDDLHVVVFCYGKKIWPWFADLEEWGAPADLTGLIAGDHIVSAVTVARQLQISDDKDNLYIYDVGTGSVGKVRTAWIPSSNSMDTVAAIIASIRADNTTQPVTIKVFADGDDDTEICSFDLIPPRTGFQRLPAIWPNVQDCEMHKLEITITSTTPEGDCGLELAESFGSGHAMLR
jgi:hypothetical protein